MIPLGSRVKCILTGFTGVAVARTEYLYSNPTILVDPCVVDAGRIADSSWLAESRLVITSARETTISLDGVIAK